MPKIGQNNFQSNPDMTFSRRTAGFRRFFLSLPNIINLFDISFLAKSVFYAIRSMAMFLKVLNKVDFRALTQT